MLPEDIAVLGQSAVPGHTGALVNSVEFGDCVGLEESAGSVDYAVGDRVVLADPLVFEHSAVLEDSEPVEYSVVGKSVLLEEYVVLDDSVGL